MTDEPDVVAAEVPGQPATQAEVTRLRAQVADLQAQLSATSDADSLDPTPARSSRDGRWRPWVAGVLIVIAAVLAPASVVATWARDEVVNTDRYVQTVAPLAADPAVQDAIVERITREIFARIDVRGLTQQAVDLLVAQGLPPVAATGLTALSAPLAEGVHSFVTGKVRELVESPQFEQAWVNANRQAHTQMVAVLTGQSTDKVTVTGNTVSVNLSTIIEAVKHRLVASGFGLATRIPEVNAQFTIFSSADISRAQTGFRLLKTGARVLPVLALLLIGLAVYLSRDRRRALMYSGLAVAASMLVLGLSLNAFRSVYLDAVPSDQLSPAAAATIYDTLVEFIRLNLRAVLVVALAVAVGGWLTGRSPAAATTRRGLTNGLAAVRGGAEHAGLRTGPVGAFAFTYRTALSASVIGVAGVVYIQAAHPTGAWTAKVLAFTVGALLLLGLLARPPVTGPPQTRDV